VNKRLTYYDILGLKNTNVSPDEVKKARNELIKHLHPDVANSEYAEEVVKMINEAYEVLSDPKKKREYDLHLKTKKQEMEFEQERERKYKELLEMYEELLEMKTAEKSDKKEAPEYDVGDVGGVLMLVGGIVLLVGLNVEIIIGGALIGVGYYIAFKYKKLMEKRKAGKLDKIEFLGMNRKEFGGILMGVGGVILLSGLNVEVIIGGALIGVGYYLAYKY
jgi:curved DNA-binding protein CbpA